MNEVEPTSNTFTDEGRILQVEYAIKNVSKAGTMVGCVCSDGIVLIGVKQSPSIGSREKVYKISDDIYTVVAGISSDAIQLVSYARVQSEAFKERFEQNISLHSLCQTVGKLKQGFTQQAGIRPFGVTLLYAGLDVNRYALYSTDPSGSVMQWSAISFGQHSDVLNNLMKSELQQPQTMKESAKSILKLLKTTREVKDSDVGLLEILYFSKNSQEYLTQDQIREVID